MSEPILLDEDSYSGAPANDQPKDAIGALKSMLAIPHIARNITHVHRVAERPARWADFPGELDARLAKALKQRGYQALYTHQAGAIRASLAGDDVAIVTPTASGKTLCFNIPILQQILREPESRALYLFPTKALAQDQYLELHEIAEACGESIKVYTFDGDTPATARKAIRVAGNIVLTNPDMLHTGILPHHTTWIKFFERLRYVVVDEVHHYRGVFGSHLANVLRRLARICEFYGSRPQFICCSATIANPLEIAEKLTGRKFTLIDDNGAPAGEKYFVFYNPPVVNEELGIRRGVVNEARRIATRFLASNTQTIVFARSRMRVEVLLNYLRKTMIKLHRDPNRIAGYRGGYLPNERRVIEQGVKSGEILGVVSTNALELGIDIGQLRAAIIAGYPGSIASTWQQAGRAGRKSETAVVVLVASSSPLDQFLIAHPHYFFGKAPESAIVNPDNATILASHIKCAAFELPFVDGEMFGDISPMPVLQYLADEHVIRPTGGKWFWSSDVYPSESVSLRSASTDNFVVVNVRDKNRIMAEVDYDSVPFLIHTQAIYMHMSETYYIEDLDWERRTAFARPQKVDYYTDALAKNDIRVLQVDETEPWDGAASVLRDTASTTSTKSIPSNLSMPPQAEIPKLEAPQHIPDSGAPPLSRLGSNEEYPLERKVAGYPSAARDLPPYGPDVVRNEIQKLSGAANPEIAAAETALNLRIPPPVRAKSFGEVVVSTLVSKYKKIRFETHENIGYGDVHIPPLEMQTEAYWLTFANEAREWLEAAGLDLGAGLTGLAHLLSHTVPLFVLCDPRDVVSVPMLRAPHDEMPTVYIYDRYPAGIGLARRIYDLDRKILAAARDIIAQCPCSTGCPSCVGPEADARGKSKVTARTLLEAIS